MFTYCRHGIFYLPPHRTRPLYRTDSLQMLRHSMKTAVRSTTIKETKRLLLQILFHSFIYLSETEIGYGLRFPVFESQQQQEAFFFFFKTSRLAVTPTQPPIQWIPEFFQGLKLPRCDVYQLPYSMDEVTKEWSYTSISLLCFHGVEIPFSYLTFQIPAVSLHTTRFNIQKFYMALALLWVFCMDIRKYSDFCFRQHKLTGFYNSGGKCLQRGTNWIFK